MRLKEMKDEFMDMFWRRQKILDIIFPPIVFAVLNNLFSLSTAIAGAFIIALFIIIYRVAKKQKFLYAIGGSLGVLISIASVFFLEEARDYFLPNLIKNIGVTVLILGSLIVRKPIIAISSHIARGWPLEWYAHKKVHPAYFEVTLLWGIFYIIRTYIQYVAFQNSSVEVIATIHTLSGIPAITLLLIVSYLYGTWRLKNLNGPSVEEFEAKKPEPWQGQTAGF